MKKLFLNLACFCGLCSAISAQNSEFKLQNYRPASPTAFQFLKYSEMPVSEYTGIPNISIPLYQIGVDQLSLPLTLTYHGGGIRVSQEASWVGLGWDLSVGSIVQEINDIDDYSPVTTVVKKLPDWNTSPSPQNFPLRWQYPNVLLNGIGWSNPYPIQTPQAQHSYMVSTAYYVPMNGNFDDQVTGQLLLNSNDYDSEPDIFKANFFGHSITFIKNWQNGTIAVLNKKGYKVTRTGNSFLIIVPGGEQFYFDVVNTVEAWSTTTGGLGGGGGSSIWEPTSKTWMLTKVVTRNNKQVLFNYTQSNVVENYPSYSQKWTKTTQGNSNYYSIITNCDQPTLTGYNEIDISNQLATTFSFSRENRVTLSSVTFPNGQVNFTTSDREDVLGGKKLDNVQVSSGQIIKSYQFNYEYFDATAVGGNLYQPYNAATFGNTPSKRLKLLSMQDNNGAAHYFTYSNTQLPAKNSLAQDYWGFYNGQLTNTSLIPNPARLNLATLGDNGNNNSANINSIKAGMLTEIKYPTGGSTSLEYEINTFDNYWVPDFTSTTNQASTGNGLRIRSITSKADINTISKKTFYTYEGGKAITPVSMYRVYNFQRITHPDYSNPTKIIVGTDFRVDELNGKGFFSTNSLGSLSGVGYNKVIKEEINGNNATTGRTETYFNNTPDIISNSANGSSQLSAVLPALKNRTVNENGTVQKTLYFNDQSTLLKKVENTYLTYLSDATQTLQYGARIFGYTSLFYVVENPTGSGCISNRNWTSVSQNLIGYYPVYDMESLLSKSVITDYDANGNSLVSTEEYGYDTYNILSVKTNTSGKNGVIVENYEHSLDYYYRTGDYSLHANNWLTEATAVKRRNYYNGSAIDLAAHERIYSVFGNRLAVSSLTLKDNPNSNNIPFVITYDKYDDYGNPLQYSKFGETSSLLWDYSGEYTVAAIQNADQLSIAYTSFEADGKGNWNFTGSSSPDNTSPTGKRAYDLAGSAITKTGLDGSKTFIVSYWLKNGAGTCVVNGSPGNLLMQKTGWSLFEIQLAAGSTSVSISGTGRIDELRLFPKGSLMTTYTYNPLIGLSSQSDANNKIMYYVYDVSGRLTHIIDIDKNILKKICYNYAGQAENCTSPCTNAAPNWQNTVTPLTCQQGICGNTGYQLQEQKDMNTCSATYNQLQTILVHNPTACSVPSGIIYITYQNPNNYTGFTAVYKVGKTGPTYTFAIPAGTGTLGCLPVGTYGLTISKPGNMGYYYFDTGCQSTTGTSATFGGVVVSATSCNSITLGTGF